MSAERSERHAFIDTLPDDDVADMLGDVRHRNLPRGQRTTEPFSWIGMIENGPRDASAPETIDRVLAQYFARRA